MKLHLLRYFADYGTKLGKSLIAGKSVAVTGTG